MKFPQEAAFDVQQNVGGGVISVRKAVRNNPPESPYLPTADDYGCFALTCDPADVTTAAAQLTVSQTLYGSLLVVSCRLYGKPSVVFSAYRSGCADELQRSGSLFL